MAEWMDQSRLATDGRFDARDEELDYWAAHAARSGGPVLELACGSGKVLIPLLERGFDISGVDTSEPMLERCRAMGAARNVTPTLVRQSVTALDLPREYGLIFGNSGFLSLFVEDDDVRATLAAARRHLKPGGTLVCSFEQVTEETRRWCERRGGWTGDDFRAPDGTVYAHRTSHRDCSSVPNTWACLLIIEKYVDGRLVATEANQRAGRVFCVEEVLRLFEEAGLEGPRAFNGFTDDPATDDVKMITVVAGRPSA
jgi:SAM-dependent methyltransferase